MLARWSLGTLLMISWCAGAALDYEADAPDLYYYGLEESERNLQACGPRQACAALLLRAWLRPALMRLCRCSRRDSCHGYVPPDRRIELNNRAYFQFCNPVTDWPECSSDDIPLVVETSYERMNPDELEVLHHKNVQLVPPKISFTCKCRSPNYWRLKPATEENDTVRAYECSSLPLCKTDEFCGNVNYDLGSLYQSCLCPKHHICVHDGGVTNDFISELLYRGRGWKAYCRRVHDDYSYEDD